MFSHIRSRRSKRTCGTCQTAATPHLSTGSPGTGRDADLLVVENGWCEAQTTAVMHTGKASANSLHVILWRTKRPRPHHQNTAQRQKARSSYCPSLEIVITGDRRGCEFRQIPSRRHDHKLARQAYSWLSAIYLLLGSANRVEPARGREILEGRNPAGQYR
jgi:hypothetical protein